MLTFFFALAKPLILTPPLPEFVILISSVELTLPVLFKSNAPFLLIRLTLLFVPEIFPLISNVVPSFVIVNSDVFEETFPSTFNVPAVFVIVVVFLSLNATLSSAVVAELSLFTDPSIFIPPSPLFVIERLPEVLTFPVFPMFKVFPSFKIVVLFDKFLPPSFVTVPLISRLPALFVIDKFELSAFTFPLSSITNPPSPLLIILIEPNSFSASVNLFVTVPEILNWFPSLVNVASPPLTKEPPIVKSPALFVTVAVLLLVAVPEIFKPPAPVFNIARLLEEIFPFSLMFNPALPWFVYVASLPVETEPVTFNPSTPCSVLRTFVSPVELIFPEIFNAPVLSSFKLYALYPVSSSVYPF